MRRGARQALEGLDSVTVDEEHVGNAAAMVFAPPAFALAFRPSAQDHTTRPQRHLIEFCERALPDSAASGSLSIKRMR
jgi:hypothetical protein